MASDDVAQVLHDLEAAGAQTSVIGSVPTDPFRAKGLAVCVAGHEVRLYLYDSEADARIAAASIDANDPSHVGRSIVEWAGEPKFWQRARVIALYLGNDVSTESALVSALGEPFVEGHGRGFIRDDRGC